MPVIKSAIKKLRKDRKRTVHNDEIRRVTDQIVRAAKRAKTPKTLAEAYAAVDKAAKNHLIHKNKAARIKSTLAKNLPSKKTPTKVATTA